MNPRFHLSVFLLVTLLAECAAGNRISYQQEEIFCKNSRKPATNRVS
jgi:hypothetical protein